MMAEPLTRLTPDAADEDRAAGRLPDFVIIGAMKSGTTSLFDCLCRHPRIYMCEPKEPMYFSRDAVYAKGEGWYRSLFAEAGADQLCGEASTCYTRAPHYADVPPRMYALLPDAKLIYIMRHPVERAYSHYTWVMQEHHMYGRDVDMTFEQALEHSREYLDTSMYIRQIERYLPFYDRSRLLLVLLDDFKADAKRVMGDCQRFLGVEAMDLTADGATRANVSDGQLLAKNKVRRGLDEFRRWPVVKQMIDLMPLGLRRGMRAAIQQRLQRSALAKRMIRQHKQRLSPLTAQTRARLLRELEGPTLELARFMGRDLPTSWYE